MYGLPLGSSSRPQPPRTAPRPHIPSAALSQATRPRGATSSSSFAPGSQTVPSQLQRRLTQPSQSAPPRPAYSSSSDQRLVPSPTATRLAAQSQLVQVASQGACGPQALLQRLRGGAAPAGSSTSTAAQPRAGPALQKVEVMDLTFSDDDDIEDGFVEVVQGGEDVGTQGAVLQPRKALQAHSKSARLLSSRRDGLVTSPSVPLSPKPAVVAAVSSVAARAEGQATCSTKEHMLAAPRNVDASALSFAAGPSLAPLPRGPSVSRTSSATTTTGPSIGTTSSTSADADAGAFKPSAARPLGRDGLMSASPASSAARAPPAADVQTSLASASSISASGATSLQSGGVSSTAAPQRPLSGVVDQLASETNAAHVTPRAKPDDGAATAVKVPAIPAAPPTSASAPAFRSDAGPSRPRAAQTASASQSAEQTKSSGDAASAPPPAKRHKSYEFLILSRKSSTNPRFFAKTDAIPKNAPNRRELVEAARKLASLEVNKAVTRCEKNGRTVAKKCFDRLKNATFSPFLAFGTALGSPKAWRQPAIEQREGTTGADFRDKLPRARFVTILGTEGVTVEPQCLLDDFARVLPRNAEIIVSRQAGKADPLMMTAGELVDGLQIHLDGGNTSRIDEDVLTWIKAMAVGRRRRLDQGAAAARNGGELRRDLVKQFESDEDLSASDGDGDGDDSSESDSSSGEGNGSKKKARIKDVMPLYWYKFFRCGLNGCPFVGTRQALLSHRSAKVTVCYGRCSAGCTMKNATVSEIRLHMLRKHHKLSLCSFPNCFYAADKRSHLDRHARNHAKGTLRSDGRINGNRWVTLERALSRPLLPEEAEDSGGESSRGAYDDDEASSGSSSAEEEESEDE